MLRAWLLGSGDTAATAGTHHAPLAGPDAMEAWDPTSVWPGGFIESVELRREQQAPGRGAYWVRTDVPLLDEPVSATARAAGLLDIANGMTVRADPAEVAFPTWTSRRTCSGLPSRGGSASTPRCPSVRPGTV